MVVFCILLYIAKSMNFSTFTDKELHHSSGRIQGRYKSKIKLPWKAISMSFIVGLGKFLSSVYIDITIPGVQKPHCEPWASAILFCTGCGFVLVLPMPSTVVTASPCMEATGAKHALTARWLFVKVIINKRLLCRRCCITVHEQTTQENNGWNMNKKQAKNNFNTN